MESTFKRRATSGQGNWLPIPTFCKNSRAYALAFAVLLACAATMVTSMAWASDEPWEQPWLNPVSTQQAADESGSKTATGLSVQSEADSSAAFVGDEIIITLEDGADAGDIAEAVSALPQADENATMESLNVEGLTEAADGQPVVVKLEGDADAEEAVDAAQNLPGVASAQLNYRYQLLDAVGKPTALTPGAPIQTASSALTDDPALASYAPTDEENAWHLQAIDIEYAWEQVKCDGMVTVAVLDTGCDMAHEDLVDNVLYDYAYNAYKGEPLTCDYYGHGTHVAGCIAATANNAKGTAGSSYNAKVLPINVFDAYGSDQWSSTTKALVAAYDYLFAFDDAHPEYNLHVVNMSLGGYGSMSSDDVALQSRIHEAKERGIVSMCAGGNGDGYGNPNTESHYPSDYPECVGVTALSKDGNSPTTWCDHNLAKDICVPGEDIYSTVPLFCKMEGNANWWAYEAVSGTSMATPIASGVMALLWAARPDLSVDDAIDAIKKTASNRLVFPDDSWYNDRTVAEYGAGILDAGQAVLYAKRLPPSKALVDELSSAAQKAESLLTTTMTSADGSDIPASKSWVSQSVHDALMTAAKDAREAAALGESYNVVVKARDALAAAQASFDEAVAPGTMPLATDEAKSQLRHTARNAQIDMSGIVVSANGSGLAVGMRWVTSALSTRLTEAISAAMALSKSEDAGVKEVDAAAGELASARSAFNAGVKTVAAAAAATPSSGGGSSSPSAKPASSAKPKVIGGVKAKQTYAAGSGKSRAAYKIATCATTARQGTVWYAYTKLAKATAAEAVVPATVKIKGGTYRVVGVKPGAFKGMKKLSRVTIGANVAKVSPSAVKACPKVKTIVVRSKKLATAASVKGALRGSKAGAVTVKVYASALKAAKKIYTKANLAAPKAVSVQQIKS